MKIQRQIIEDGHDLFTFYKFDDKFDNLNDIIDFLLLYGKFTYLVIKVYFNKSVEDLETEKTNIEEDLLSDWVSACHCYEVIHKLKQIEKNLIYNNIVSLKRIIIKCSLDFIPNYN